VIAAFAKALLSGQRRTIYDDGRRSRDFTFVANAVHGNLLAAQAGRPLRGQIVNVGTGRQISVEQLARSMALAIGLPDLTPVYRPERAGDIKHSFADLNRAAELLNYRPLVSFEVVLEHMVGWYRTEDELGRRNERSDN
jgi:nucleoside-diphosphate-sugar epimerase